MANESEVIDLSVNALTDAFLGRWDRKLSDDNRCYGVKICLAGAENKKLRDGLYRIGVRYISISYYYFRKFLKTSTVQAVSDDLGRFSFVFLDSGGFTLRQEIKSKRLTTNDLTSYADSYQEDLKKFGHLFAGCSEVDLPVELGIDYSEKFKTTLLELGVPIVPVIRNETAEHYDRLGWFTNYPYIAIGADFIDNKDHLGRINEIQKVCKDKNILVHGLGSTDLDSILQSRFYSVASTSWVSGSKFGNTMYFEHGHIRYADSTNKQLRRRFKKRFEDNGLIWEDIADDKKSEVDIMNALAWRQLSDYIKYSAQKCYWITSEEKDLALTLQSKAFNADGLIDRKTSIERATVRRLSVNDADCDDRAHEVLHCDTCYMSGRCPRHMKGEPCGFDINVRIDSQADLHKMLRILIEAQYGRAMTGILFEKLEGGVVNKDVSAEVQRLIGMVDDIKGILKKEPEAEMTIHAKGNGGTLANMMAAVFAKTGSGGSGSGNTRVQRDANKIIDVPFEEE